MKIGQYKKQIKKKYKNQTENSNQNSCFFNVSTLTLFLFFVHGN